MSWNSIYWGDSDIVCFWYSEDWKLFNEEEKNLIPGEEGAKIEEVK